MDCSVAMAWCFGDQADDYTYSVLDALGTRQAVVPSIWPLEVANSLVVAERRKKIDAVAIREFLELVGRLDLGVDTVTPHLALGSILELARRCRLSAYDAAYLELAARLGLPLATRDAALKRAAIELSIERLSF